MAKCMLCGGEIHWNGDFMLSELDGEEVDEMDDRIVNTCTCSNCGAEIEVLQLSPNQEKERGERNEDTYGTNECFACGCELELVKETTRSEYYDFEFDPDMNNKMFIYKCKGCGAESIFYAPIENEEK